MCLTEREDRYNRLNTRNEQNTTSKEYNCGGYALRTFNWFVPYTIGNSNKMVALDMLEDGCSFQEVRQELFRRDVQFILRALPEKVRLLKSNARLASNEELVAFRVHCSICGDFFDPKDDFSLEEVETDFHFRVRRNGKWMEKNGAGPIVRCRPFTQRVWNGNDRCGFPYYGETALFVVKTF